VPPKDKEWFRNYAVFYRAAPSRIEAIEELIVAIQNECNLSRSSALMAIFDAGVEAKAEDPTYGTPSLGLSIAEARLSHALSLEIERQSERAKAYKQLGPLGILAVAERAGIDPETAKAVLDACRRAIGPVKDFPPSHAYRVWISHYLQDGESHKYKEVVRAAIEDEILPDPEVDADEYERCLSLFKQVASTMGASSGKRGWWKLPDVVVEVEEDPF